WEKGHPTMEGRRLIIMMVVGGMTQYLAKVQGMPPEIEKKLERRIRAFLWNDKTLIAVNKETVYAPIDMGGRNLLDIVARNEAITATWLKSYLDFGPSRPLWGFAADEYLSLNMQPSSELVVDKNLRTCVFLQAWNTGRSLKPKDLVNMLKVARQRGVQMEGLAFSRQIMREATIWYHIKATVGRGIFNRGAEIKCLKENHRVKTVGQTEILARRLTTTRHHGRSNCACQ
ncbi:hypothetical protein B0H12DRAFT_992899, partial [Mycena haematopus]